MKLNRKSGAKLAMTAAVLVVTGATLIGAPIARAHVLLSGDQNSLHRPKQSMAPTAG
jgi:hypothetical protein